MSRDVIFESVLADHGAMLRRIAHAYEREPALRDELEQEIRFAVWRALPRHRSEMSLKGFVARVAYNRALTHVSKEAARPRSEPIPDGLPADAASPEHYTERQDIQRRLKAAVSSLPLPLRHAAGLTLEGFSPVEIAQILDLTPNVVSIRLTRAKQALKDRFAEVPR